MKKELNQIIMVIGFAIALVGVVIDSLNKTPVISTLLTTGTISVVLSTAFIFSGNNTVKNVGYGLGAFIGANGIYILAQGGEFIGAMVFGIGLIVIFVATFLYFLLLCLKFFGFAKNTEANPTTLDKLFAYKQLLDEKVVNEQEFNELKKKLLSVSENKVPTIEDLKKWRKAVDQKIISEQEYDALKTKILLK